MKRVGQRRCRHCGAWFRPEPRNARHQRYCSEPACRQASKAASQRQWLAKPENQDYFHGAEHVARVRRWRAEHPGYWRRTPQKSEKSADALQEDCPEQTLATQGSAADSEGDALQEVLSAQPAVLIGLIAHLTDSPLQEDIVRSTRRLLQLGQDILNGMNEHADQARHLP
ncbi:hypothetical protein [Paraburkholderia sp. BR13444]|uniref:hypothetical protein n=1 Tax=Paraburkholderia sp. BR13444 TaxID=3236997 RepID=UPI0034CD8DE3